MYKYLSVIIWIVHIAVQTLTPLQKVVYPRSQDINLFMQPLEHWNKNMILIKLILFTIYVAGKYTNLAFW